MGYYFIKYCLVLIFFPNKIIILFIILASTYFEQLLLIVFIKIIYFLCGCLFLVLFN